jgi:drug/metabolite transporter (DMT)-like permease
VTRRICLLILLSALWGGVFLQIKYALVAFSASKVAFLRSAIGALGLLVVVLVVKGDARAALGDVLRRPLPALLLGALAILVRHSCLSRSGSGRCLRDLRECWWCLH